MDSVADPHACTTHQSWHAHAQEHHAWAHVQATYGCMHTHQAIQLLFSCKPRFVHHAYICKTVPTHSLHCFYLKVVPASGCKGRLDKFWPRSASYLFSDKAGSDLADGVGALSATRELPSALGVLVKVSGSVRR